MCGCNGNRVPMARKLYSGVNPPTRLKTVRTKQVAVEQPKMRLSKEREEMLKRRRAIIARKFGK